MSNESSARRILPQSSQMGSFSFVPQQQPQRETQRNYVFVDEHNRHKRLKVMRACEGCRKRKIKCDAATTNTWPCSACIRLRLECVRPHGLNDGSSDSTFDATPPSAADLADQSSLQDAFRLPAQPQQQAPQQSQHHHHQQQQQAILMADPKQPSMYAAQAAYPDVGGVYQPAPYPGVPAPQSAMYATVHPSMPGIDSQQFVPQPAFHSPPNQPGSDAHSTPENYTNSQDDAYQPQDLSDLLGSLKVDTAGSAPYLRIKATERADEEPVVEEAIDFRSALPPLIPTPGDKVRIPPELMPDDQTAMHYFDLYFSHAHPYVPVLNKTTFYQQWNNNREALSPLIIEVIFAVGEHIADEPAQGQQWLALATQHAYSFMDAPRLSTLQAMMIMLKAREAVPKKGYYFRSWTAVTQVVQLGKDLGLHEHYADHQAGQSCGSNPSECYLKTRIWQNIFVCEVMIGSPQGRTDLAVDVESVDFSMPRLLPGEDESEFQVSRNFIYLARNVRNVSKMNTTYGRIRRNPNWGVDPEFVQLGPLLDNYLNDLPGDLTVSFPPGDSPPWISSPFVGNLLSYYYLTLVLLHRPQLAFLDPMGTDGQYKHHLMLSYSSAKAICRLQEGVFNTFGILGLQSMQRGLSFHIYSALTCVVLHLVAITSPDPELNCDAREYFTRHMRLLEEGVKVWSLPEMKAQVDAVREAFSADVRKPFVLKPSFPYGSPHSSNHSGSPPAATGYPRTSHQSRTGGTMGHQHSLEAQNVQPHPQVSYSSHPITPPVSTGSVDPKSDSPDIQSLVMMANPGSQASGISQTMSLTDTPAVWNPQRIFEQWHTSFAPQIHSQAASVPTAAGAAGLTVSPPGGQSETPPLQGMPNTANVGMSGQSHQLPPQHQQYSAPPTHTFVTPAMWQESVASVYEGGLKRAWDYDGGPAMKRTR